MDREVKAVLPKKKVVISTKVIGTRPKKTVIIAEDVKRLHGHGNRNHRKEKNSSARRSISDLMTELLLDDEEKENMFDPLCTDDIRRKPDLWMAAFDNPIDFIEYCRKRLDHERELLERSRQVEEEILQFVQEWTKNTEKHANILGDLYKVQDINDKLQEVIMEERTHCQHLVGENDHLETERQVLSRKYQAALLLGKVDEKSVKHLLEKNPKAVPLADKLCDLERKMKQCSGKNKVDDVADSTVLVGRVKRLEAYVDSLMRQHREEVSVLKETISQGELKCESIKAQYTDLLQRNTKSLNELKEVLGATVRENLDLRAEILKKNSEFFVRQNKEMNDKIRKPTNRTSVSVEVFKSQPSEECTAMERQCQMRLARSEIEVAEKANLLRETVNKLVILERRCARLEEENQCLKKGYERSLKVLKSKNDVLEKRCERTESRLKLENAGVTSDIRECKTLTKLLVRNVKSFTREQAEVKKKLASLSNVGAPDPEAVESLKAAVTQKNSDLRLHAMNVWVDYLDNKVKNLEEGASSGRSNYEDEDSVEVVYRNPATGKRANEVLRTNSIVSKSKGMKADENPSMENISGSSSSQSMPPKWIPAHRRPSNYAHCLKKEEVLRFQDASSPPPLD